MRSVVLLNLDEDRKIQAIRSHSLERAGFHVVNAAPGPSALTAYSPVRNEPVLVVLHGHLSGIIPPEFCACLKAEAGAPLLLLRFVSSGIAEDATEWADICLGEPATETELISAIRFFARIVQQQDIDRHRIESLQLQLAEQRQALEELRNERRLSGKIFDLSQTMGLTRLRYELDMSPREQMDEVLRESERRLRRITASVPGCVYQFRIDPDGRMSFPFMSDGIASVYGIGAAEAERSAQMFFDPVFEEDLPMVHASIRRSRDTLERWRCEYRIHAQDGTLKWLRGESTPQREADGSVLWHGLITDITESRILQESLRQSHDLLQNLSARVPGLFYRYQYFPDGRSCFPYANAAMSEIYEVTPEQVREDATPVIDRLHPDDYEGVMESIRESACTLETWQREYRVMLPRQGLRWLFGDARPQRMADGSVLWHGFTTDITERKRMEEALRASERRLKAAERMARLGHFEIDSGTVVLSDGAYRLLGLDPESGPWSVEVFRPLIHKDDVDRVYAGYAQILKDGKSRDFIHRMIIEGEIRYFRNWVQAGADDTGRVIRLFGTIQDITEQVRIERELRFKTDALENSLNGFEIISAEGKILYANRASLKMWGYASLDEIVGTFPLGHCVDPGLPGHIIETLRTQGEYLLEFQARRKDGYIFQAMVATRRFLDENGRELFMRTSIDITDRKCAEIALRESQERFRFWMAATGSFFWIAAPDGTAIDRQPPLETSTGQPWEWLGAVHPEDRERVRACYQQAAREQKMYECEVRYWHPASGQYRWYLDRSIPRIGPRGEVTGWIGASVDIQKQKEAEFALQAADRRKDEFLAMLGHELRNPLAPIRNAAQILNSKEVVQRDPSLEWACGMIDRQVVHLVRLVDDLLDVSRLVQGKIVLKEERVNLVEVVGHAVELGRSLVQGRHQHLSLYLPGEPLCIYGDKVRLTQVVENLLTNAAKYTPEGGQIRLDLYHQDREAVICIRDTGLGIAADLLPHIFDLFTQAHRDLDRRQGGLGIGLTVVKGLVQLHKGRIEVRSDGLGKGSEFTVYLPLDDEAASGFCPPTVMKVAEAPPMAPVARRLLIVDDNADALESLAVLLELEGHTVQTALDGPAALTVADHFRPDIILLDIGLPGMDGYEVAHRLRALDATRDTLLVAVTGYGQEGDRMRAKAAGFDHHFVKPIDVDALQRLLCDLGGTEESSLR